MELMVSLTNLSGHRILLERLFETLFPPWYGMGNFHALSSSSIPELPGALRLIQSWVRNQQFDINRRTSVPFFLNSLMATATLVFRYDREMAIRG